ncbi:MAG: DUF547 domain-containing protein [Candidatus Krumholzibacteria bacterium]|nr:DUF547 domain-containing protein [Candidatus Krumholzibacteria bacterium]
MRMSMPWCVALATVLVVSCGGQSGADVRASSPLVTTGKSVHELFTEVVRDFVTDGKVDYPRLCQDERLQAYISQLAATDPDTIDDDRARLAFWINAYNAYTLKVICDNYPVKSINDLHFGGLVVGTVTKKTVWDRKFVVVGGAEMSLNHVEHEIVRPIFKDPRAHYALVCASESCPALRTEAFEGDRLDEQLDDQARVFFGDETKNRFDVEKKIAYLSKILDWYSDDFGDSDGEILLAIAPYVPVHVAESIRANPGAWDVKHTKYDWSLNE